MDKSKLTICLFGTYDRNYTSNKLILQGLLENKVDIVEINSHTPVTKLDSSKEMTWLKLTGRILKKYRIFAEIIRNFKRFRKVDAIYVGYPGHFDVLIAYPIAKLFRKKLIFNPLLIFYTGFSEEQGILNKKSILGKIIKTGETIIYNLCDLVFADTPYQKKYLMADFKVPEKNLRVLPIGADDKYYQYTPYTNLTKKINVVYYGLYSPIHGVEHIIETANILRNYHDIKFTFVGNGQTFKANYERAKELKLSNVEFFYDLPVEKHPAIIKKADIFLGFLQKHPSVDRIIPNKIYQGLALGKTIITADAPVIKSIFTHKKNIYLCKPADPKDFAKAVIDLKNQPKLRKMIAENGHNLFEKEFTPKAVGKKLVSFTKEIL
ncbi:MAG TPA: glycosyltransferase family 4 protein [Candidatus Bathyarchaeia archaeon]|nr:glycosyltransferase family 4 protein [Candidatus Bathyarchaeia archaeon]